jgi:hypothetical protein
MRWKLDETAMDSRKRIYHDVENDEDCLLVVVAGVGTRRFGRKISSESSPERKLYMKNFGEGWRELRAAAHDKGCTSKTRTSRATPSYI